MQGGRHGIPASKRPAAASLYIVGQAPTGGIYAIDVCLLTYIVAHGAAALHDCLSNAEHVRTGVYSLFGFSMLATCSGVFNVLFVTRTL